MKRWLFAVAASVLFVGPLWVANAQSDAKQDPARIAAAKELLDAMGGASQLQASITQLREALSKDMGEREPTKAKEFAAFLDKEASPESARVKTLMSGIDEAATAFYAERFTAEEMKAIAEFLKSVAGRKFQELTPQLAALVGPRLMAFQKQLIADLQTATNQPQWPGKPADAPK